jgi:hypothetical protein
MFPNSNDLPSSLGELAIRISITGDIPLNLGAPPIRVPFWPSTMLRAAMPKTAINKDGRLS